MKKQRVTMEMIQKVVKGILDVPDLGQGVLLPKKRKTFLEAVEVEAEALGIFRRIDMNSNKYHIDKVAFPYNVLQPAFRPNGTKVRLSETREQDSVKPDFSINILDAVKFIGLASLEEEVLDLNMTEAELENYILNKMAKSTALDLERTFTHGNKEDFTYEQDKMLSSTDGWLAKSVNLDLSTVGISADDYLGQVKAAIAALPRAYRKFISNFRVYADFETLNLIQDQIQNRETALGDSMVTGQGEVIVRRVKVEHLPVLDIEPNERRVLWLTLPSNTVYGVFKDIRVRSKFELLDGQIDIKSDVQSDAHFEEGAASIVIKSPAEQGEQGE